MAVSTAPGQPVHAAAFPWFAVRVREKARLAAEEMFRAKAIEYFSPAVPETRVWSDRRKVVQIPLFPGYVFCRLNPQDSLPVLRTPGVIDIVRRGANLAEVDPGEVEAIRRVFETQLTVAGLPQLVRGQRVLVLDGPLRDLEGVLLEQKAQCFLVLGITLMNRSISIEIGRHQVRAIP